MHHTCDMRGNRVHRAVRKFVPAKKDPAKITHVQRENGPCQTRPGRQACTNTFTVSGDDAIRDAQEVQSSVGALLSG